jgi:hypothetical protein
MDYDYDLLFSLFGILFQFNPSKKKAPTLWTPMDT